jgi:hypothetical protein
MEGTPTELADATRALFNARLKGIFDTSGTIVDRTVITIPPAPEPSCPSDVQNAYQAATLFEMNYEDCLSYAPWLDVRVGEQCTANMMSVASDVTSIESMLNMAQGTGQQLITFGQTIETPASPTETR